ncbi:hypothetical protein [Nitratidesulfovibrio sp.]|uniref:hypothetical protein n=1 Tax=Nitratidesulfovibrio sp. TaxID=2802297 RepID=UPI00333EA593
MKIRLVYSALLATVLALISGCATPQPRVVYLANNYNYSETKPLLEKGPNTIKGSALWRQQGGGVVTCAGNPVALVPKTAYSSERFIAIYGNDMAGTSAIGNKLLFSPENLEYQQHMLKTQCDAQGYFTFENVANGDFFVMTSVVWSAGTHNPQGGAIMKTVSVRGGEVKNVILAP